MNTTLLRALSRAARAALPAALLLGAAVTASAAPFRADVIRHRLDNGMTFLMVPDPGTPVVASFLYVDVGSVDEVPGITGTAHVLEHMMFKGTTEFGALDPAAERRIMSEVDEVMATYLALRDEEIRGLHSVDPERLHALRARADSLEQAGREYTVQNDLDVVTNKRGFSGLNAFTSEDQTVYIETFPPNLLEIWAYFESHRIAHPVFREFYSERDVVMEERRRSYDTDPDGSLYISLLATAYEAHPYQWSAIGWESDLQGLERDRVEAYFREHYAPNHLTMVVVGNFEPDRVRALAEKYFAPIPPSGPAHVVRTIEPPQDGERRVTVRFDATPRLALGFHTTAMTHPDRPVVEVIDALLTSGRTSRLYQSLVLDQELASWVGSSIRGDKYPGLFIIDAAPREPERLDELETALIIELGKLAAVPVTDRELVKVKNSLDADFVRALQNPTRLALNLAVSEVIAGSWESMLDHHDAVLAVTADDVQRVAAELFVGTNRTVGRLVPPTVEEEDAQ